MLRVDFDFGRLLPSAVPVRLRLSENVSLASTRSRHCSEIQSKFSVVDMHEKGKVAQIPLKITRYGREDA